MGSYKVLWTFVLFNYHIKRHNSNAWHILGTEEVFVLWINNHMPGLVVLAFNPSTLEAEAGELWLSGQPGLHRETVLKTKQQQ
jgi:hypothetical protein